MVVVVVPEHGRVTPGAPSCLLGPDSSSRDGHYLFALMLLRNPTGPGVVMTEARKVGQPRPQSFSRLAEALHAAQPPFVIPRLYGDAAKVDAAVVNNFKKKWKEYTDTMNIPKPLIFR